MSVRTPNVARCRKLVRQAIDEKKCTKDVGGELGTRATGDWVVNQLRAQPS